MPGRFACELLVLLGRPTDLVASFFSREGEGWRGVDGGVGISPPLPCAGEGWRVREAGGSVSAVDELGLEFGLALGLLLEHGLLLEPERGDSCLRGELSLAGELRAPANNCSSLAPPHRGRSKASMGPLMLASCSVHSDEAARAAAISRCRRCAVIWARMTTVVAASISRLVVAKSEEKRTLRRRAPG